MNSEKLYQTIKEVDVFSNSHWNRPKECPWESLEGTDILIPLNLFVDAYY